MIKLNTRPQLEPELGTTCYLLGWIFFKCYNSTSGTTLICSFLWGNIPCENTCIITWFVKFSRQFNDLEVLALWATLFGIVNREGFKMGVPLSFKYIFMNYSCVGSTFVMLQCIRWWAGMKNEVWYQQRYKNSHSDLSRKGNSTFSLWEKVCIMPYTLQWIPWTFNR